MQNKIASSFSVVIAPIYFKASARLTDNTIAITIANRNTK